MLHAVIFSAFYLAVRKDAFKNIPSGAGVAISLALLYIIFRSMDLKNLWALISNFGLGAFFLLGLLNISSFFFRAVKWQIILRPIAPVKTLDSSRILLVSYLINNTLPAHLGEPARAYILSKRYNTGFASALSTVFIDRVLDGLTMLVLFLFASMFARTSLHWVYEVMEIAAVFVAIGLAFFILPVNRIIKLAQLPNYASNPVKRLVRILKSLSLGREVFFSSPRKLLILFAASFATWLVEALFFYLVIKQLGIQISFPAAPGYIGTYEGFMVMGLLSYGAGKTEAAAAALVAHAIQYVSVAIFGVISLKTLGLSWRNILKADELKSKRGENER